MPQEMHPIIDASTAVYEPTGTKRAASAALPCKSSRAVELHQPLPQDGSTCDQACPCKRRRTSDQVPSMKTQNTSAASPRNPPSIIWHDFPNRGFEMTQEVRNQDHKPSYPRGATPNMMTTAATPSTNAQDSHPGIEHTVSASDERLQELKNRIIEAEEMEKTIEDSKTGSLDQLQEQPSARTPLQAGRTEAVGSRFETGRGPVGPQQRRVRRGHNGIHSFYTKAAILLPRGIAGLYRVHVDERSSFNLLPRSIAIDLGLILYADRILTITVAGHLVQTNQYCRFTIRVAGHDTPIIAGVISGLQIILLGREWMQSVNLLSNFGNQSYYIPIPLTIEAAEEEFPGISDAEAEAKGSKEVGMATSDEIGEECDDDEDGNVDRSDDTSSEGELSSDNEHSSDDETLSDSGLSSGELSSDAQNSLGGDPSDDELSLAGDPSSESEISLDEELILDEHELEPTDEDDEEEDEIYGDDEDYDAYEGEGCKQCAGCKECQECEKCEECGECEECECEGCDSNLQDVMEQHKRLKHFAKCERTKEARDIAKLESEPKHDESVGGRAFDMDHQQSEPNGERDNPEQLAAPSPTPPQTKEVRTPITKRQAKDLANTLNHISRTQAGQSFKAPVEQLWPDCTDAYAAKVPNPIDLGTIEVKVKNNMYNSMDDFRADAILLHQNSVDFNGIDHIVTSAALEVRDAILKAISDIEKGKGSTRASPRGL